jgi:site-specific DNA-methyltransferase (adenine-specific)
VNVDACRVGWPQGIAPKIGTPGWGGPSKKLTAVPGQQGDTVDREGPSNLGRWPANIIHDGSDEVVEAFAKFGERGAAAPVRGTEKSRASVGNVTGVRERVAGAFHADSGSAARFFYCAKASKKDRDDGLESFEKKSKAHIASKDGGGGGWSKDAAKNPNLPRANIHPTVKPTDLMRYLVRLVTPPNGIVLDPFMGSGSTGKACMLEGFKFAGIDMTPEYVEISRARIKHARKTAETKTQNLFNKEKK